MTRHPIVEEDLRAIVAAPIPWDMLRGRTVLISGAAGFMPRYLVETLLFLNERQSNFDCYVVGMVRNLEKARRVFAHHAARDDFEIVEHDVCRPWQGKRNPDFIIHAASQASPRFYGKDPVGTLSPNILGTFHLLELARLNGVRGFLFFSSAEVYGESSCAKLSETDFGRLDPASVRACYGESKRAGETMCVSWHAQFGVPAKIVRPFHTYGPGMALDDGRVYADFVANILRSEDIRMKSAGEARRAFCYLADATAGFFTVLIKGMEGQAYNVGNPDAERSIRELAEELVAIFPEKHLRVLQDSTPSETGHLRSHVSRVCPDISKTARLGWKPITPIHTGFRRTIASWL